MATASDGDLATRTRFLRITPATSEQLRGFWPKVEAELPSILDGFYQHVMAEPHLRAMVETRLPHQKQSQTSHLQR